MLVRPQLLQLKLARHALNLNQRQVAAQVGISNVTLANIELGNTDPQWTTVTRLSDFYTANGIEFGQDGWVRLNPNHTHKETGK
jgi:DNA-binding XRE family transcriptional regulator